MVVRETQMKTKTITLNIEHWEEIRLAAESYDDCGPLGEGWQSEELSNAYAALEYELDQTPVRILSAN